MKFTLKNTKYKRKLHVYFVEYRKASIFALYYVITKNSYIR